jgi:hypothetical protein
MFVLSWEADEAMEVHLSTKLLVEQFKKKAFPFNN